MWGMFAASLGVAAMLSHRPMERATLQERAADWPIGAPLLPHGWMVDHRAGGDDPTLVLRAHEATAGGAGRTLDLRVIPVATDLTPLEFLARQGLTVQSGAGGPRGRAPVAIEMVGQPGLIISQELTGQVNGQRFTTQAYFAAALVPQRFAVLVSLFGVGPPQADDLDLLRRVAKSIELRETIAESHLSVPVAPPVNNDPPGEVLLPGGASIALPAGYTALAAADPNSARRTLVKGAAATIDLVPCVVLESDVDDDKVAMAALHDPAFHGGTVRVLRQSIAGLAQWQIVPRAGRGGPTPTAAYLAADASGAAVLALFRAPASGAASSYDVAWQSLVAGLRFGPARDLAPLSTAGERAAERVQTATANATAAPPVQWWIWLRDGNHPLVGWSSQEPAERAGPRAGVGRAVWRAGDAVRRCEDRWEHDAGLTAYRRQTITDGASGGADAGAGATHSVRLAGRQLRYSTTSPAGTAAHPPRTAPPNFVPGPALQSALSHLRDDGPMLLRTDCFPGHEPCVRDGLLTLLIEPAAPQDDTAGPDALPRTLSVTVNGSGERSLWSFNPDGSVAQVAFGGGLVRKPSTETEIENSFNNDERMKP